VRVGVDVGGTFTDLALWDGTELRTTKVPTTPRDQSTGVVAAVEAVSASGSSLVHGTTVATNALLEREGARTVLVTDSGFEDLLEIGRQDRPSLYDLDETRTPPLVDRRLRLGVAREAPLTDAGIAQLATAVSELAPEAIAVSVLFSFEDPDREQALAAALQAELPDVPISLSSTVVPEFREYERTTTTVTNAYLTPVVGRYLQRLGTAAAGAGVTGEPSVMRSSGGLIDLSGASRLPASIVLSGPAGGVVAAAAYGEALTRASLVSFDMGGTSTDVCRVTDGRPEVGYEQQITGLPNRMPSVAVHTVGAGGGSIGWVDPGGALRVGPSSAGADPGPACYGRGGVEPTVTDANLVTGRLGAGAALGSSVVLRADAAQEALSRLGAGLGLSATETALGMIEVVESLMVRAIRVVSIEQGVDPRESTLVAFGGAGGMHASALARRLGMRGAVIPPHAGVFSALGLLLAPPRADVVRGVLLRAGGPGLVEALAGVRREARDRLQTAGSAVVVTESHVDVRYRGQSHELSIPVDDAAGWESVASAFHRSHHERNGFSRPDDPIEVVAVRAACLGDPSIRLADLPAHRGDGADPRRPARSLLLADGAVEASVWWRPSLDQGTEVAGPAVIEEPEATTVLSPGERATVHPSGALEVDW